jgi:hypothetical protein
MNTVFQERATEPGEAGDMLFIASWNFATRQLFFYEQHAGAPEAWRKFRQKIH